jgi:hypothetical protein
MKYDANKAVEILGRTPVVLTTLLGDLHEDWIMNNEGPETFSPFDVVGHMLHGEKTDWCSRISMILEHGLDKTFISWDRFAMYEESKGKTMKELLVAFADIRKKNVEWFMDLQLTEEDLDKKGMHPKLGEVTLRQLLSTWVIHDLSHIAQITRVMAKQYRNEMGPWREFFRIMEF